jgi:hyperosmotically inducible protein
MKKFAFSPLLLASAAILGTLHLSGCAVSRNQETVGAYIDDSSITARIKSRFFESQKVDGTSISVETLNGTVMLSGFAKSPEEMASAGEIARSVPGVKRVKNEISVRG